MSKLPRLLQTNRTAMMLFLKNEKYNYSILALAAYIFGVAAWFFSVKFSFGPNFVSGLSPTDGISIGLALLPVSIIFMMLFGAGVGTGAFITLVNSGMPQSKALVVIIVFVLGLYIIGLSVRYFIHRYCGKVNPFGSAKLVIKSVLILTAVIAVVGPPTIFPIYALLEGMENFDKFRLVLDSLGIAANGFVVAPLVVFLYYREGIKLDKKLVIEFAIILILILSIINVIYFQPNHFGSISVSLIPILPLYL